MRINIKLYLKNNTKLLKIVSFIYSLLNGNLKIYFSAKNMIRTQGVFLRRTSFDIKGKSNQIVIDKLARLKNCNFTIIGNNCKIIIGGGSTIISNTQFWCQDDNSTIFIGKDFTMEGGHIASTEGQYIKIGNDCMFSGNIDIRNGDSHSIIDKNTRKRKNHAKSIEIGNHVWLAAYVRVLKGAYIPNHSVIGNSSVVTSKLEEENSIYSGIPCKIIKTNIDWDRNKI